MNQAKDQRAAVWHPDRYDAPPSHHCRRCLLASAHLSGSSVDNLLEDTKEPAVPRVACLPATGRLVVPPTGAGARRFRGVTTDVTGRSRECFYGRVKSFSVCSPQETGASLICSNLIRILNPQFAGKQRCLYLSASDSSNPQQSPPPPLAGRPIEQQSEL